MSEFESAVNVKARPSVSGEDYDALLAERDEMRRLFVDATEQACRSRREADALKKTLTAERDALLEELEETHAALCLTPDYIGTLRYRKNAAVIANAKGEQL